MPDTHDERGGNETTAEVVGLLRSLPRTKITPENITQHMIDRWYREKGEYLDEIRDLREQLAAATEQAGLAEAQATEIQAERNEWQRRAHRGHAVAEILRAELAAVTARAEKAEALVAELRTDRDHCVAREITAKIEARQLRARLAELGEPTYRGVACWPPIAAPDGLSATETDAEPFKASGVELEFGKGVTGLSEPEPCDGDCDCDCQPGQPCLCPERDCYCGPCRVCGDTPQTPDDDTTGADR